MPRPAVIVKMLALLLALAASQRTDSQRVLGFERDATAPAPEEPRRIGEARDRVVHQLDSAAALLPGDEWIAGQRVRYIVEAGRTADAIAAAHACRAAAWWCEALAGFALHAAGDFAGADTAYRAALSDMPREERC